MKDFPPLVLTAARLAVLTADDRTAVRVFLQYADMLGDSAYANARTYSPAAAEWLDEFTQQFSWLLDVVEPDATYE